MKGFHWYFKVLPTARAYVARPFRWGITGAPSGCFASILIIVAVLVLLAGVLSAQVDAVVMLHGRDAELRVANPTARALQISVAIYRNASTSPPLGDSVAAKISPQTFVLPPGASQLVRLRVRAPVAPHELLRFAVTFTPVEDHPAPALKIVLATRIIGKLQAGP
jgi:P pilus assembly chaperone PapD